jgi:hypothetical protein
MDTVVPSICAGHSMLCPYHGKVNGKKKSRTTTGQRQRQVKLQINGNDRSTATTSQTADQRQECRAEGCGAAFQP